LEVPVVEAREHGLAQHLGTRRHRRLHHAGQRRVHDEGGQRVETRPLCSRALVDGPLRVGERRDESQRLGRVVEARRELVRALLALHEDGGALGDRGHEIFSTFTRNALNSGVLAPTSPTIGVSAFASQYCASFGFCSADTPMNPQWIGMPIWKTFLLPASVTGPRRLVTSAATSSLPRGLDTRTRSPFLIFRSAASSSGSSTKAWGWRPTSSGTCWVT